MMEVCLAVDQEITRHLEVFCFFVGSWGDTLAAEEVDRGKRVSQDYWGMGRDDKLGSPVRDVLSDYLQECELSAWGQSGFRLV